MLFSRMGACRLRQVRTAAMCMLSAQRVSRMVPGLFAAHNCKRHCTLEVTPLWTGACVLPVPNDNDHAAKSATRTTVPTFLETSAHSWDRADCEQRLVQSVRRLPLAVITYGGLAPVSFQCYLWSLESASAWDTTHGSQTDSTHSATRAPSRCALEQRRKGRYESISATSHSRLRPLITIDRLLPRHALPEQCGGLQAYHSMPCPC